MISDLIRKYIAGPVAAVLRRLPYEPTAIAGAILVGVTFFRDQLQGGADLETALTASIVALGTWLLRQNVWSDRRVKEDFLGEGPLPEPITGLEGQG